MGLWEGKVDIMEKTEQQLIKQILDSVTITNPKIKMGIGDDCAVVDYSEKFYQLISTDILVEDVHFDLSNMSLRQVGYKALACNISDIAAMAGEPEMAVIALVIPERLDSQDIAELYEGITLLGKCFGVNIIGGDISRGDKLCISITILGIVKKDKIVYRNGAKDKDLIFVSGHLGASIKEKHYSFMPRIKEAKWLSENNLVHSMIDLSDGIAKDLSEILIASKVTGAVIEKSKVPFSEDCFKIYDNIEDRFFHAMTDGEDFELLFTVSASKQEIMAKSFCEFIKIGYIDAALSGIYVKDSFGLSLFKGEGFGHF